MNAPPMAPITPEVLHMLNLSMRNGTQLAQPNLNPQMMQQMQQMMGMQGMDMGMMSQMMGNMGGGNMAQQMGGMQVPGQAQMGAQGVRPSTF
jgi:hypothetical protein